MTSPLITEYVAGLHDKLPAAIADEAADGLIETYEHHLEAGSGQQAAARAAVTEFGDLVVVIGEFTRQAPGRRTARLLLATGPVVGLCWAAALTLSRAWTWPAPGTARVAFAAVLLLAILGLVLAATSQRSYRRTRLAAAAGPAILALDLTAVAAVMLTAPALTLPLSFAIAVSLTRAALIAWTLPRLASRVPGCRH